MKKLSLFTLAVFCFASFNTAALAADNLGSVLKESGWDVLIGTWVDEETKGEKNTTSFAWKYDDQVIESYTKLPHKNTMTILARNFKTGEIFVSSADSAGGSSNGSVTFEKGLATFKISYAAENGDAGDLEVKYKLIDENKIEVTFEMGQPVTINLVRK